MDLGLARIACASNNSHAAIRIYKIFLNLKTGNGIVAHLVSRN